jgi:hypothetical protein
MSWLPSRVHCTFDSDIPCVTSLVSKPIKKDVKRYPWIEKEQIGEFFAALLDPAFEIH